MARMIRHGWLVWLAVAIDVLRALENRLTATSRLWLQFASSSQTTETEIHDATLPDFRECGSQMDQFGTGETGATVTDIEHLQARVVDTGQIHFPIKPAGCRAGFAPGRQICEYHELCQIY